MMEKFTPVFQNDDEKYIMIAMIACCLFLGFISPLLVLMFAKQNLSELSLKITKAFLNFELFLAILVLIVMIPIIGWFFLSPILGPVICILNLIFPIWGLIAAANNQEFTIPTFFKFVK